MTTPDLPDADPLDEVASALLDGEASAEEQARAGDADVAARVASFEVLVARVREPLPVDPVAREAAISAALGAARSATVVPMRRRRPRWLPAAAAAVVVVVLGGAVIAVAGSDDSADEAATATADDSAAGLEEAGGGDGTTAFGDTTVAADTEAAAPSVGAAAPAVVDLGDISGAGALTVAVRDLVPPGEDAADRGAAELQVMAAGTPCVDRFGVSLVVVATARLDGTPVTIGVLADEAGQRSYVALDQADCQRQVAAASL